MAVEGVLLCGHPYRGGPQPVGSVGITATDGVHHPGIVLNLHLKIMAASDPGLSNPGQISVEGDAERIVEQVGELVRALLRSPLVNCV